MVGADLSPIGSDIAGRRTAARLIFVGAALGSTSLYAAFTAAPLVAREIGVSRSWTGVPGAASIIGTAVGSALLSWVMSRRGRRAGLRLGWIVGVGGAVVATAAVSGSTFVGLLVAMILIGIGHSANQLSRFAAADLFPEEARAGVLGWLVWAGTIGAALGPGLLGVGRTIAKGFDLSGATAGFLIGIVFFAGAAACALALRSDRPLAEAEPTSLPAAGLRAMTRRPHVRAALIIMITGQVTMVMIMTMTPLHVSEHGHSLGTVGLVMSSHLIGMFAFSPLIGKFTGRYGTMKAASTGMFLLLLAAAGAATVPGESSALMAITLFLLGVGWCFSFVAGSALLTRGLAYVERVRLQGGVDGLVWTSSAVASLSSGALLGLWDYSGLALVGGGVVLICMSVLATGRLQLEPAPARS